MGNFSSHLKKHKKTKYKKSVLRLDCQTHAGDSTKENSLNCKFNTMKESSADYKSPLSQSSVGENRKTKSTKDSSVLIERNRKKVVAQYDYQARSNNDMTIKTGDVFEIIEQSNEHWWLVENVDSKVKGYVPSNYLGEIHNQWNNYPWYFGKIKRQEAEQIILEYSKAGTYLIRESESKKNSFAISLLTDNGIVRHYIIKQKEESYYLGPELYFTSLANLVEHYTKTKSFLSCCLLYTPKKYAPQTAGLGKDTWEISRDSIELKGKIGGGNFGDVWQGIWNKKVEVAVKTLKSGQMSKEEFLKEGNIMKNLHHPRIVQLLAICTDGEPIYLVTEFMANGSLYKYLKLKSVKFTVPILVQMCSQIADGISHIISIKSNFFHSFHFTRLFSS